MEQDKNVESHWASTRSLMFVMLFLWFVFGFAIHYFVNDLNQIQFLGFPLGFYMAAQGSLIAFVVILVLFAKLQDGIDERHGMSED
jgi:putative solute:sodium symporter small subunit